MRERRKSGKLTVHAVAGTYVTTLGMDMPRADCDGMLGFAIHRTDLAEDEARWMEGLKTFEETDPGFPIGAKYPTNRHPIQGFTWADFSAKPGRQYIYKVQALGGTPRDLQVLHEVTVPVTTEAPDGGTHMVYFNRGAAASQEFARRFGNTRPDESDPTDPRWEWLSRGAAEAVDEFVSRAKDDRWALRVSAYEFRWGAFAEMLAEAKRRGVDVQVHYDGNPNAPDKNGVVFPRDLNDETAREARIKGICKHRLTNQTVKAPPISHHKFIVLVRNGKAKAVLTGSTNFSLGGVFGQSNVVHVVDDEEVADLYLKCWETIHPNPTHAETRAALEELSAPPEETLEDGSTAVFSPQATLAALELYAKVASEAKDALFMTFAFGMNKLFKDIYATPFGGLRYGLMDKLLGPGVRKEKKAAALAEMQAIRNMTENRLAVGNKIATNTFDRWAQEKLTGLNQHVQFIHTKFMLVDPLSADPIVVTGSANFSDASTTANDENMLLIRGDRRTADIYLGEYMRLWNHYAFREFLANGGAGRAPRLKFLDTENRWWKSYFGDTDRSRQRAYFAGA